MADGIIEPDGLAEQRGSPIGETLAPSSFPTFVLRSLSRKSTAFRPMPSETATLQGRSRPSIPGILEPP
jgi:hypothetical protein